MTSRRNFLPPTTGAGFAAAALAAFPPSIRRALAIEASSPTGTIQDVKHVVMLMLENRSFDGYFGTFPGVRGFGDRFPIPLANGKSVFHQTRSDGTEELPYHLDTREAFDTLRIASTPHTWSNAQDAWEAGRMGRWPAAKKNHSMAYYTEADMPFQYAMARAFTICDAYHCSFTGGTNTNRLFVWSGTHDGAGRGNGPALGNVYNKLKGGDPARAYTWTTYPARLAAAGVQPGLEPPAAAHERHLVLLLQDRAVALREAAGGRAALAAGRCQQVQRQPGRSEPARRAHGLVARPAWPRPTMRWASSRMARWTSPSPTRMRSRTIRA
ncbi:hypothetical protein G6F31_015307 [Rhizopus arrhizus]|nr:hypothetical protein G6F31_015307 [Rhizopus arrhizus]